VPDPHMPDCVIEANRIEVNSLSMVNASLRQENRKLRKENAAFRREVLDLRGNLDHARELLSRMRAGGKA